MKKLKLNDFIILVNKYDEVIGYEEKMYVHMNNMLHRAFSVFIFDWNTKKLLLQKRAYGKYHSGELWTNACCSHPRMGETMEDCINVRLKEELGMNSHFHIEAPVDSALIIDKIDVIYSCGKFSYFASYGDISENEIDHVFLYSPVFSGIDTNNIFFNKQEIEELKWITIDELKIWLQIEPEIFTAWFRQAFELAYEVIYRQANILHITGLNSIKN